LLKDTLHGPILDDLSLVPRKRNLTRLGRVAKDRVAPALTVQIPAIPRQLAPNHCRRRVRDFASHDARSSRNVRIVPANGITPVRGGGCVEEADDDLDEVVAPAAAEQDALDGGEALGRGRSLQAICS
jgi:hypothetical protein